MALLIEDGRGFGFKASVSRTNRLNASAKTAPRLFYINRDERQAYSWISTYSATSGDEIIYLKNTSKTKDLFIDIIKFSAEAGRATFTLYEVSGTGSGTTISGKNLNLKSGNTADATSLGDASVTGITLGAKIDIVSCRDDETGQLHFDAGLILGLNDAIAISFVGSAGTVSTSIRGYFEGET